MGDPLHNELALVPWWTTFVLTSAYLFGSCIGSFLNVVIYRLPAGKSVVHPGSACPSCEQPIAWYDNLPVVSWFVLLGKCRHCKAPFSFRYAAIELAVGLFAAGLVYRYGLGPFALSHFVAASIMIAIAGIDHDSFLIDTRMTLALAVTGLLSQVAKAYEAGDSLWQGPLWALCAGIGAFGLLWLIGYVASSVVGEEAMGGGDAPLFAAIVILLGPASIPLVLLLTGIQGMLIWALLRHRGGVGDHDVEHEDGWAPSERHVPMGLFLVLAALEMQLGGDALTDAYLDFVARLI
tara:strand:- start:392 stop:1270 length:879 start_codon:yes stop_codon:yes gene_type:complete